MPGGPISNECVQPDECAMRRLVQGVERQPPAYVNKRGRIVAVRFQACSQSGQGAGQLAAQSVGLITCPILEVGGVP